MLPSSSHARIAILTVDTHREKPWIANLVKHIGEHDVLDAGTLSFDVSAPLNFDIIVNRISDCGSGDPNLVKFTHAFLAMASLQGVRVINGAAAYGVCMSKLCQHAVINACGYRAPASNLVRSVFDLVKGAKGLAFPLLLKPNSAGSGSGMMRFDILTLTLTLTLILLLIDSTTCRFDSAADLQAATPAAKEIHIAGLTLPLLQSCQPNPITKLNHNALLTPRSLYS